MEMFRVIPDPEDCGSSVVAISSHELLSDDTLKRTDVTSDTLSSVHTCLEASKLTGNGNDTALPVKDVRSTEAAVGGEREGERRDGDVVVLSDTKGANGPQKKSCCADVPTAREEVGDIVTLEPTINKEVPASICRESNSPSLYSWRFPLPYCSNKDDPTVLAPAKMQQATVKIPVIEEKEPLRDGKEPVPIIKERVKRETAVDFDVKKSVSRTSFVGKDSAV